MFDIKEKQIIWKFTQTEASWAKIQGLFVHFCQNTKENYGTLDFFLTNKRAIGGSYEFLNDRNNEYNTFSSQTEESITLMTIRNMGRVCNRNRPKFTSSTTKQTFHFF